MTTSITVATSRNATRAAALVQREHGDHRNDYAQYLISAGYRLVRDTQSRQEYTRRGQRAVVILSV